VQQIMSVQIIMRCGSMSVRKIIVLVFVWALLALVPSARAVTMAELEEQLTTYFNEHLYGSCKAVVLTERAGDVYEGYVLFMNGRRSDLRVTVSDRKIEYTFVKPAPPGSGSPDPQQMQAHRSRRSPVWAGSPSRRSPSAAPRPRPGTAPLRATCRRTRWQNPGSPWKCIAGLRKICPARR
jgi:hypothetical protein